MQSKLHIVTAIFGTVRENCVFKYTTLKIKTFYLVIISRYNNRDTTDFISLGGEKVFKEQ